jgi:hypothetical protein
MNLRTHFNLASFKTKGLTLLIEHSPCCLLSFASGFVGMSALAHNPALELGFALGGALIGDHIGHKYLNKDCCKDDKKVDNKLRRYSLALCFGLASWGAHQVLIHDHDTHSVEPHEIIHDHACDHEAVKEHASFYPPEMQKTLKAQHDKAHQAACAPH